MIDSTTAITANTHLGNTSWKRHSLRAPGCKWLQKQSPPLPVRGSGILNAGREVIPSSSPF